MKYCKICGLITKEDVSVCPSCGNPMIPLQLLIRRDKKVRNRIILILLSVCLLIGSGFAAFTYFNNLLTKKEAQEIVDNVLVSVYVEAGKDNLIAQATKDRVEIHVDKLYRESGTYYADCTVTAVDILFVLQNLVETISPDEVSTYSDVNQMLMEKLQQGDTIVQTFTIRFPGAKGNYVAIFPEELISFCLGNPDELLSLLVDIAG